MRCGGLPKPQVLHRILTVWVYVCLYGPISMATARAPTLFFLSKLPNRAPWNGKWNAHHTHLPLVIISIMLELDISSRKASTYTHLLCTFVRNSASLQNLPCQHTCSALGHSERTCADIWSRERRWACFDCSREPGNRSGSRPEGVVGLALHLRQLKGQNYRMGSSSTKRYGEYF